MTVEENDFHAQAEGFEEAQARAVEELANETEGPFEVVEQRDDLVAREDRREVLGAMRSLGSFGWPRRVGAAA